VSAHRFGQKVPLPISQKKKKKEKEKYPKDGSKVII
jgi:hypothetical protein